MKKAALYVRVSTQEQANEGYSIDAQKEKLISYCKLYDYNIYNIYVDAGYSGSSLNRPAISQLIENLDKFDCVLVYKLDRLSRHLKDILFLIEEEFEKNKVSFISINENFDTSKPMGKFALQMMGAVAELERAQITERTSMGRRERASNGLYHGGPYLPIGYNYIDGQLVIDEYESMQVKEVYELYLKGYGLDKIAGIMKEKYTYKHGDWQHSSSVASVLDTPIYAGYIVHNDEVFEGKHEAIIDRDTFEKVQALRNKRKITKNRAFERRYLLSGITYCANCGGRYFGGNQGKKNYYMCYSRRKTRKNMIIDPNCKNKNWPIEKLEEVVLAKIKELRINKDLLRNIYYGNEENKKTVAEKKTLTKRIGELDKQISRLMDLYQVETMPIEVISERIEKLYSEKKKLEQNLNKTDEAKKYRIPFEYIEEQLNRFDEIWDHASPEERRVIIEGFIERINIDHEDVRIKWNF